MYTEKVLEHFRKPHNYGRIENPDAIGKVGNVICGDIMHLYIKVEKNEKDERIIKDIKFETLGCTAALATSSVITDLAKGKTLKEAIEITNRDIIKELESLPPVKVHCSLLASDALSEAIYDYLKKNNLPIPNKLSEKHKKTKEDMHRIEEKYKEFIKMEENIHKK